MLTNEVFPEACGLLHDRDKFLDAFEKLLDDKTNNILSPETGGEKVELFKDFLVIQVPCASAFLPGSGTVISSLHQRLVRGISSRLGWIF